MFCGERKFGDDDARFENRAYELLFGDLGALSDTKEPLTPYWRLLSMSVPRIAAQSIRTTLQRATSGDWKPAARTISTSWTRSLSYQRGSDERGQHTSISSGKWRAPRGSKILSRARRRFSASAIAAHGHLTPPKPGEEYRFLP